MWLRGSPSYLEEKTIMSLTNQVTIQFVHVYHAYHDLKDSVNYHHGRYITVSQMLLQRNKIPFYIFAVNPFAVNEFSKCIYYNDAE